VYFRVNIPEQTFEVKAGLLNCFKMRAAGDKVHFFTGLCETGAEIAADGARRHDHDFHALPTRSMIAPDQR
jgi:hypothetical protein